MVNLAGFSPAWLDGQLEALPMILDVVPHRETSYDTHHQIRISLCTAPKRAVAASHL